MNFIKERDQIFSKYFLASSLVIVMIVQTAANSMGQVQVQTNISASGLNTNVGKPRGNVTDITGGMRPNNGTNLFHSFGEFNIGAGDIANFRNNSGQPTENILSRVTGDNPSNIFGTIQTTGFKDTNLFLMNPSGIVFGPKASLNISGSFYATTANSIDLENSPNGIRGVFHANKNTGDVLTSAAPEAFGFLGNNRPIISVNNTIESTAAIRIEGLDTKGSDVVIIGRDATIEDRQTIIPGVQVAGELMTQSGDITLASVNSSGRAVFGFINSENFFQLGQLGELSLVDRAKLNTQGNLRNNNGGNVVIKGGEIKILTNSKVVTSPMAGNPPIPPTFMPQLSFGKGGNVEIKGTQSVSITGSNISSSSVLAFGGGGSVSINAPNVTIIDNSIIQTSAAVLGSSGSVDIKSTNSAPLSVKNSQINTTAIGPGAGNGGNITLTGPQAHIDGSRITSNTGSTSASAGTIEFNVDDISFTNNTQVDSSASLGESQAGNIRVQGVNRNQDTANSVLIDSDSTLSTTSGNTSAGAVGGSINIHAKQVALMNGGGLNANGRSGEAGIISVTASESVTISGASQTGNSSQISAIRQEGGIAGTTSQSVEINTANLSISGGNITLTNEGNGPGGNLLIQGAGGDGTRANSISISGQSTKANPSGLFTTTLGTGPGGNTTLLAHQVMVTNDSEITASSNSGNVGAGPAGSVIIESTNSININGATIATEAKEGDGGGIQLTAGQNVELNEQALVTAKSANGNAGDISFDTENSILIADSLVTTSSGGGNGGNIDFVANNVIFVDPSVISSSVGNGVGGNIIMESNSIVFQESQVLANATGGQGGNILMSANVVLQDPFSRFDASAGPAGIDGMVNIRAPIQNLNGTIAPLPENIISTTNLYSQRCAAQKNGYFSSFAQGGRTGPPPRPNGFLVSPLDINHKNKDISITIQANQSMNISPFGTEYLPDEAQGKDEELVVSFTNSQTSKESCLQISFK